jgi:hypothetical protein
MEDPPIVHCDFTCVAELVSYAKAVDVEGILC